MPNTSSAATDRQDFNEALYVYSLDAARFDIVHRLLDTGFSPRPNLAFRADLTPGGAAHYDNLVSMFAVLATPEAPMSVVSRPSACHGVAKRKKQEDTCQSQPMPLHPLRVDAPAAQR